MPTDDTTSPTDSLGLDASAQQFTELVVANPVPSVLAAAATGAALMALIALAARPKTFPTPKVPVPKVKVPKFSVPKFSMPDVSMPKVSIPKMAKSLPDLPEVDGSSLKDQLADLAQRVADAFPSKRQAKRHFEDAQESLQDTVQSTWNTVRDQASGVIDQVQPQFEAATKVARENPLWAALIVGALGTLLGSQLLGKTDK